MADEATIGTGTTIAFEGGFLAMITAVNGPNASRPSIDTSHMTSGKRKCFKPGKQVDPGELQVDLLWDPTVSPPIDEPESACVMTLPDADASTITCMAFLTDAGAVVPMEEKLTMSCTLKLSGEIDEWDSEA